MTDLTIAAFAREGGVGVETVRYYQRRGLLPTPQPARMQGRDGFRRYGEADVRRLRFIRSAQAAGFTLEQIIELLDLDANEDRARARALAQRQITVLDSKIADLQTARASLARLAQDCAAGDTGPCPIIEAFDQAKAGEKRGCR